MPAHVRPVVRRGSVPGRGVITLVGGGGQRRPRHATLPPGPAGQLLTYASELAMCLIGPFMLVAALFIADDLGAGERWGLAAGGVLGTGIGVASAVSVRRANSRSRRDTDRLNAIGVAATAEITAIAPATLGREPGVALTLRISGPGFEPFEVTSECRNHSSLRVGAQLAAVVDPADRLFAIIRQH
jgi:hypothetical protein